MKFLHYLFCFFLFVLAVSFAHGQAVESSPQMDNSQRLIRVGSSGMPLQNPYLSPLSTMANALVDMNGKPVVNAWTPGSVQMSGNILAGYSDQINASSGSAVTLTSAQSGQTFLLDRAAGVTYTLPTPVVGLRYTFIVSVSVTSNNHKIITATPASQFVQGIVSEGASASSPNLYFGNGSTHVAVTMNGTTTGGLIGTQLTFICISATKWQVIGTNAASGTIATPFTTS